MASEVFLAVFSACFDVRYDVSNESSLRWWVNENICMTLSCPMYIHGDLHCSLCTIQHEGHCPKVLLWIMEEFFYISHELTDEDHNGHALSWGMN